MNIFCVKTSSLPEKITKSTGGFKISFDFLDSLKNEDISWIERSEAETNFNFKQIIPYVILQKEDGKIACYQRHGTEKRLHGFYSCGFGGHVEENDKGSSVLKTIKNGMLRELGEEVSNFPSLRAENEAILLEPLGVINEVESEAGLVHLGVVFLGKCKNGFVPKEADETKGLEWKTRSELSSVQTELWTRLSLELIERKTFCLLNHELTQNQITELRKKFNSDKIIYPDKKLSQFWKSIPPENKNNEIVAKTVEWIKETVAEKGDLFIVQGEFGSTFTLVDYALKNELVPIYATTKRVAKESSNGETVHREYIFEHVCFKKYEYYSEK